MSTPNYIMPERQEYSLFDVNLKGKIVKRNSVAYNSTQDGRMLAEETIDRTDFYPYGLTESPSIGIYPVANMLVGKLTGKYRFEYPYYNYELELFCHEWNDRGQATHFVNLQLYVGSTISALKYYELIEDTGTVVGVPWKSHFTRSPNAVKSDLFPHFDPDYKLFSDPEKWDRYFHVTPADWTGAKAPVESENQSWRLTAQFIGYNYVPYIDRRCYQLDQSYFKSATQFMHYLYFPVAKGVPVDRGGCLSTGIPDITSILSKALPDEEKHNYKPEYLYFSGLTANTVYNVKTWVKYLDENDVEQIIYSDAIQVPTLAALTYPLGNTLYFPSTTAPFTKEIALPNVGLWYLRAIVTTVTGKLFLSPVMQVTVSSLYDPNTNPNVENGGEVFAPYQNGNYNGREYYFGDRRWIYNGIDGAWRLDYGYKKEAVQAQIALPTPTNVPAVLNTEKKLEDNAYATSLKLDRIPRVGEKIDGFEVVKVFYSDDSDIGFLGSGDNVGVVLVNFDEIVDLVTYSEAKYRAMALSAELMPLNKYPHIVGFIKERAGLENGMLMWSELENDNNEAFAYEVNDEGDDRGQWLTKEESESQISAAMAIPVRIIIVPKYLTTFFAPNNTSEYLFQNHNSGNKSFVGDIQHIRVMLKRKYSDEIVSTVESSIELAQNILITDTNGYSKIEYIIKTELQTNITLGFGYLVWIDSISTSGGMDISDADYELLVSTI